MINFNPAGFNADRYSRMCISEMLPGKKRSTDYMNILFLYHKF